MGKIESTRTSIFSQVEKDIKCPLCQKILSKDTTFIELNFHLYYCGKKKFTRSNSDFINYNYNSQKDSQDIILFEYNSDKKISKNMLKENDDIIKSTVNDFQLAIDYNEIEDIYEEQIKNINKNINGNEKYFELRNFIDRKKSQMNYNMTIKSNSYTKIFKSLKEINLYYDIKIIYQKENNVEKIYSLNYILDKYIRIMVKFHIYEIVYEENLLSFSFKNKNIDFEMIGIILTILFIYPEIKIRYKFPILLFKMILNQNLSLEDIKYENKKLYHKLFELINFRNISELNLHYTYNDNELILGGSNIKIDSNNIYDYIEKVVNFEMNNYKKKINIIKTIIFQFIPKKYILSFNAEQIEKIINKRI
jgi:hypothetical protein